MAETSAASAIVHEVLYEDNYDEWKYSLVTYLMAQDLWDVIEEDQPIGLKQFLEAKGTARAEDFEDEEKANDEASKEVQSEAEIKAWLKKNATALHVIIISCGKDALWDISGIISAKKAWKTLEAEYNPTLESSDSEVTPIKKTDESFVYQPFFDAVRRDDWSSAREFLNKDPEALSVGHPDSGRTALHIAVMLGNEQMVQNLIQVMREEDLDDQVETALILALAPGKPSIVKILADRNRNILGIPFENQVIPVCLAFSLGNINLARSLYSITPEKYLCRHGAMLLVCSMHTEQYDIALDLLQKFPSMTISEAMLADSSITLLENMLTAFPTASRRQQLIYENVSNSEDSQSTRRNITCSGLLKRFAYSARKLLGLLPATLKTLLGINHRIHKNKLANACVTKVVERICDEIKNVDDRQLQENTYISKAIIQAITHGALELLVRLTNADPRLSRVIHEGTRRRMIAIAIHCRQEKIVSFYMHMEDIFMELFFIGVDKSRNSPLHMTGLLPPSSHLNTIHGPALRMQKELQWFQEVESLIEGKLVKSVRNHEGMTAREYFTKNHEQLRKDGEKWMKDTASSYSVVAALIVTMTFAAGFIVPGVTDESMRSLSRKKWFLVFLISDSVSLFSSTTSVLMSLGILTSRYSEEAFLTSLPTKLILGMSALFLSIATMMLCFCAALYEMLQGQLWILIPIILLATVPVCLFIKLQFPLLVEIFKSTYGSGIGIAPKIYKKRWFFW